mgnify:CR=1 FL=1
MDYRDLYYGESLPDRIYPPTKINPTKLQQVEEERLRNVELLNNARFEPERAKTIAICTRRYWFWSRRAKCKEFLNYFKGYYLFPIRYDEIGITIKEIEKNGFIFGDDFFVKKVSYELMDKFTNTLVEIRNY